MEEKDIIEKIKSILPNAQERGGTVSHEEASVVISKGIAESADRIIAWGIRHGFDLSKGYQKGSREFFQDTLLEHCVVNGYVESVRALIEAGAPLSHRKHSGSLLEDCCHPEIARLLFDAGAKVTSVVENETKGSLLGYEPVSLHKILCSDFKEWRKPRFGASNPEKVDSNYYRMAIGARENSYVTQEHFLLRCNGLRAEHPIWIYERFGMSLTRMPDGRFIEIGGEHEEDYDEDFVIFNDVIVHSGSGDIDVYLYPRDIFPPTDFHSATLVNNLIYIIGSAGYPEDRDPSTTPVYTLDANTFRISRIPTTGEKPGWISGHKALLAEGYKIIVWGGKIDTSEDHRRFTGTYELDLRSNHWRKLTLNEVFECEELSKEYALGRKEMAVVFAILDNDTDKLSEALVDTDWVLIRYDNQNPMDLAVGLGFEEGFDLLVQTEPEWKADTNSLLNLLNKCPDPGITRKLFLMGAKLDWVSDFETHAAALGFQVVPFSDLSRDEFDNFATARRGTQNPEKVDTSYYTKLIRAGGTPRDALRFLYDGCIPDLDDFDYWTYSDRRGKTQTLLPDGRTVEIGGHHEEFLSGKSYMYNDVIVHSGTGEIDVYFYPEAVLPPFEWHTAKLQETSILIAPSDKDPIFGENWKKPTHRLDINTFEVSRLYN